MLDFIAALLGLIVLFPLFVVTVLLIKWDSRGPMFYRGLRVGKAGQPFRIFKFRTMTVDAAARGPGITTGDDPRVTHVGRVLRRMKIDELPQLLNVLKGEMSLVGPRPEDPRYVAHYTPTQRQLLSVLPGITSPASLKYRHEETLLSGAAWERSYLDRILPGKLELDLEYIRRRTFLTDLELIARTAATLLGWLEGGG